MSPKSSSLPAWICSQLGAREHFAVPRALQADDRLATLYTDFWAGPLLRRFAGGRLRPLAARFHPELGGAHARVQSWNVRSLRWEFLLRRHVASQQPYHGYIEVGRRFSTAVRRALQRQRSLSQDTVFFSYDTGALETLDWCRENGLKSILCQMDPNRVEVELVRMEEKQWPGWALYPLQVPEEYFVRREQEWAMANQIMVNSEFSRRALIQQGVSPEKLTVVPLCFEAGELNQQPVAGSQQPDEPLRVLFLGQVVLRKGIQYLLAAARSLEREKIHFDIVGPIGISAAAIASAPGNVTFHGRAGRVETAAWYRRSHLFVLPTLSDGFAITQLEAMAHGLPVVTTPCCGEVVSNGADGFTVPPRDAAALGQVFQRYLAEPELLPRQRAAALSKARQFAISRLTENLIQLGKSLHSSVSAAVK